MPLHHNRRNRHSRRSEKASGHEFRPACAILGGGAWPLGTSERAAEEGKKADLDKEREKVLRRLPANGFAIPAAFREQLAPYDTDHDGRLTPAEIEAMPDRYELPSSLLTAVPIAMNSMAFRPHS